MRSFQNKRLNREQFRTVFLAYSLIVILLAVLPLNGSSSALNRLYIAKIRLDHISHFFLLIPWSFLMLNVTNAAFKHNRWIILVSGLIFALVTEGIQYLLTYRAFGINDLIANTLGVIIGSLVLISDRFRLHLS